MLCLSERTSNKIENKNEFGWWINETEMVIPSPFSKNLQNSNSSSSTISEEPEDSNYLNLKSKFCSKTEDKNKNENKEKEKSEGKELSLNVNFDKTENKEENSIENGFGKSRGFSYTPERLVKTEEYKILSPPFQSVCIHSSESRQKKLSELIDPSKIGATYLQKLLCPSIIEIEGSHYFGSRKFLVQNEIKNQIGEKSLSTVISDFEKLRRTSKEKKSHKFSSSEKEDTSGNQSTGWSLDTSSDPTRAFLRLQYQKTSSNDEDELISEDLEIDSDSSTILLDDSDCENLSELQSKVERLRAVNEDIQKDIGKLKEDFQTDDWKVNDLLEETSNFRKEIQEVKYLDDLLNLLRGELERISQKTWPFVPGHVDPYSEEINLII